MFCCLKVAGATWSWWIVALPLLAYAALYVLTILTILTILFVAMFLAVVAYLVD